jgi:hypothetical protein
VTYPVEENVMIKRLLGCAILALAIAESAFAACPVPRPGATFDAEELLEQAGGIYLVEVADITPAPANEGVVSGHFRIIETLRGKKAIELMFAYWSTDAYGDTDFAKHSDKAFWTEVRGGGGRSKMVPGTCGPAHAFRTGEKYLLFPDMLGAMKSAEIVRAPDDEWLKYVRSRAKAG